MTHPITRICTTILAAAMLTGSAAAQTDTTFTYQGELMESGSAADGFYSMSFTLFDALSGGAQVGSTVSYFALSVEDGLFNAKLDFGAQDFGNEQYWLEVIVDGNALLPRQPMTASPFSIQTRGIYVSSSGDVGIGTTSPGAKLVVEQNSGTSDNAAVFRKTNPAAFGSSLLTEQFGSGRAIQALNHGFGTAGDFVVFNPDNDGEAVRAETHGFGLAGLFTIDNGFNEEAALWASTNGLGNAGYFDIRVAGNSSASVYATTSGTGGRGVYGIATAPTGASFGVTGQSDSSAGYGVYGLATAASGTTHGVYGKSESTSGRGMYGWSSATSGGTIGVYGRSDSTSGKGMFGWASATSGETYGVYGQNNSTSGRGVYGWALAATGETYGVYGQSASFTGVGVYGLATANGGSNYGVLGENTGPGGNGVRGIALSLTGNTTGVVGLSHSDEGDGVQGSSLASTGTGSGVVGWGGSTNGYDFYAAGYGINYGSSSSIRWKSNIVNIDHPLDKLAQLRGVYYDWDEEHGGQHDVGMIAEEVGKVLPEIVGYEKNGVDAIGIDYSKLTPLLVEATNALRAEKDAEITELRGRIEELERIMTLMMASEQVEAVSTLNMETK